MGLLRLFQLFPIGLRQGVQSESDLQQTTFAYSFFEEINANLKGNLAESDNKRIFEKRKLDDVANWNDPVIFWRYATENLGSGSGFNLAKNLDTLVSGTDLKDKVKSENLYEDLFPKRTGRNDNLYFGIVEDAAITKYKGNARTPRVLIPPQIIVRLRVVNHYYRNNRTQAINQLPNSYVISVISSDAPYPSFFQHKQIYSREFYYQRRP